jgi:hypothetical protein
MSTTYDLLLKLVDKLLECEEDRRQASSRAPKGLEVPPRKDLYLEAVKIASEVRYRLDLYGEKVTLIPFECPWCEGTTDAYIYLEGKSGEMICESCEHAFTFELDD